MLLDELRVLLFLGCQLLFVGRGRLFQTGNLEPELI
jgi:hypothetical protein